MSKTLNWLLRHGAAQYNLVLRDDGYVRIDEILKLRVIKERGITTERVQEIVGDQRGRYKITEEEGVQWIRAQPPVGGTTRPVTDASKFPVVCHGSYQRHLQSILNKGLLRMGRPFIYVIPAGPTDEDTVEQRLRPPDCDMLIYISRERALESGLRFQINEFNVLTTEGNDIGAVPVSCMDKIVNRTTGRVLMDRTDGTLKTYLENVTARRSPSRSRPAGGKGDKAPRDRRPRNEGERVRVRMVPRSPEEQKDESPVGPQRARRATGQQNKRSGPGRAHTKKPAVLLTTRGRQGASRGNSGNSKSGPSRTTGEVIKHLEAQGSPQETSAPRKSADANPRQHTSPRTGIRKYPPGFEPHLQRFRVIAEPSVFYRSGPSMELKTEQYAPTGSIVTATRVKDNWAMLQEPRGLWLPISIAHGGKEMRLLQPVGPVRGASSNAASPRPSANGIATPPATGHGESNNGSTASPRSPTSPPPSHLKQQPKARPEQSSATFTHPPLSQRGICAEDLPSTYIPPDWFQHGSPPSNGAGRPGRLHGIAVDNPTRPGMMPERSPLHSDGPTSPAEGPPPNNSMSRQHEQRSPAAHDQRSAASHDQRANVQQSEPQWNALPGDRVFALYQDDGNFYDARILNVNRDRGQVQVAYKDTEDPAWLRLDQIEPYDEAKYRAQEEEENNAAPASGGGTEVEAPAGGAPRMIPPVSPEPGYLEDTQNDEDCYFDRPAPKSNTPLKWVPKTKPPEDPQEPSQPVQNQGASQSPGVAPRRAPDVQVPAAGPDPSELTARQDHNIPNASGPPGLRPSPTTPPRQNSPPPAPEPRTARGPATLPVVHETRGPPGPMREPERNADYAAEAQGGAPNYSQRPQEVSDERMANRHPDATLERLDNRHPDHGREQHMAGQPHERHDNRHPEQAPYRGPHEQQREQNHSVMKMGPAQAGVGPPPPQNVNAGYGPPSGPPNPGPMAAPPPQQHQQQQQQQMEHPISQPPGTVTPHRVVGKLGLLLRQGVMVTSMRMETIPMDRTVFVDVHRGDRVHVVGTNMAGPLAHAQGWGSIRSSTGYRILEEIPPNTPMRGQPQHQHPHPSVPNHHMGPPGGQGYLHSQRPPQPPIQVPMPIARPPMHAPRPTWGPPAPPPRHMGPPTVASIPPQYALPPRPPAIPAPPMQPPRSMPSPMMVHGPPPGPFANTMRAGWAPQGNSPPGPMPPQLQPPRHGYHPPQPMHREPPMSMPNAWAPGPMRGGPPRSFYDSYPPGGR